jgi:glycolate oxidase
VEWVTKFDSIKFELIEGIDAYLLIEVDGNDLEQLHHDCLKIGEVLDRYDCADLLLAESSREKEELWSIRRKMPLSVKANSVYREEDTVVPRAELPILLQKIKEVGNQYGFQSICYGHAGDGNLHVNIIKASMSDYEWNEQLPLAIREIFKTTVELGGTLSGEHGIGLIQKPYMDIKFSPIHLELMKGIKRLFDPLNILNPGKIIP